MTQNFMWEATTLVTDADLTSQESRMPEAAKKVRGESGASPYDGKRDLAKKDIAVYLKKKGFHTAGLLNPFQLKRAAVFYELFLIYSDMSSRNDMVTYDKAKRYLEMFRNEVDSLELDYDPSLVPAGDPTRTVLTSIPLERA